MAVEYLNFHNETDTDEATYKNRVNSLYSYRDNIMGLVKRNDFVPTEDYTKFLHLKAYDSKKTDTHESNTKTSSRSPINASIMSDEESEAILAAVEGASAAEFIQLFMDTYMSPVKSDIEYRLGKVAGTKVFMYNNSGKVMKETQAFGQYDEYGRMDTTLNLRLQIPIDGVGKTITPVYNYRKKSYDFINSYVIPPTKELYANLFFPPFRTDSFSDNTSLSSMADYYIKTRTWNKKTKTWTYLNDFDPDAVTYDTGKLLSMRKNPTYRLPAFKAINDNISFLQYVMEQTTGLVSTYLTEWDLSLYIQEGLLSDNSNLKPSYLTLTNRIFKDNPAGYRTNNAFVFGTLNAAISKTPLGVPQPNTSSWNPGAYPLSTYWIPYESKNRGDGLDIMYDVALQGFEGQSLKDQGYSSDNYRSLSFREKVKRDDQIGAAYSGWINWDNMQYWQALYTNEDDGLSSIDIIHMTEDEVETKFMNTLDGEDEINGEIQDIIDTLYNEHDELGYPTKVGEVWTEETNFVAENGDPITIAKKYVQNPNPPFNAIYKGSDMKNANDPSKNESFDENNNSLNSDGADGGLNISESDLKILGCRISGSRILKIFLKKDKFKKSAMGVADKAKGNDYSTAASSSNAAHNGSSSTSGLLTGSVNTSGGGGSSGSSSDSSSSGGGSSSSSSTNKRGSRGEGAGGSGFGSSSSTSSTDSTSSASKAAAGFVSMVDADAAENGQYARPTGIPQWTPALYGGPHGRCYSPKTVEAYFEENNELLRNVPRMDDRALSEDETQNFKGNEKNYSMSQRYESNQPYRSPSKCLNIMRNGYCDYATQYLSKYIKIHFISRSTCGWKDGAWYNAYARAWIGQQTNFSYTTPESWLCDYFYYPPDVMRYQAMPGQGIEGQQTVDVPISIQFNATVTGFYGENEDGKNELRYRFDYTVNNITVEDKLSQSAQVYLSLCDGQEEIQRVDVGWIPARWSGTMYCSNNISTSIRECTVAYLIVNFKGNTYKASQLALPPQGLPLNTYPVSADLNISLSLKDTMFYIFPPYSSDYEWWKFYQNYWRDADMLFWKDVWGSIKGGIKMMREDFDWTEYDVVRRTYMSYKSYQLKRFKYDGWWHCVYGKWVSAPIRRPIMHSDPNVSNESHWSLNLAYRGGNVYTRWYDNRWWFTFWQKYINGKAVRFSHNAQKYAVALKSGDEHYRLTFPFSKVSWALEGWDSGKHIQTVAEEKFFKNVCMGDGQWHNVMLFLSKNSGEQQARYENGPDMIFQVPVRRSNYYGYYKFHYYITIVEYISKVTTYFAKKLGRWITRTERPQPIYHKIPDIQVAWRDFSYIEVDMKNIKNVMTGISGETKPWSNLDTLLKCGDKQEINLDVPPMNTARIMEFPNSPFGFSGTTDSNFGRVQDWVGRDTESYEFSMHGWGYTTCWPGFDFYMPKEGNWEDANDFLNLRKVYGAGIVNKRLADVKFPMYTLDNNLPNKIIWSGGVSFEVRQYATIKQLDPGLRKVFQNLWLTSTLFKYDEVDLDSYQSPRMVYNDCAVRTLARIVTHQLAFTEQAKKIFAENIDFRQVETILQNTVNRTILARSLKSSSTYNSESVFYHYWVEVAHEIFSNPSNKTNVLKEFDYRINLYKTFLKEVNPFIGKKITEWSFNNIYDVYRSIGALRKLTVANKKDSIETYMYAYLQVLYEYRKFYIDKRCNKIDGTLWAMRALEGAIPGVCQKLDDFDPMGTGDFPFFDNGAHSYKVNYYDVDNTNLNKIAAMMSEDTSLQPDRTIIVYTKVKYATDDKVRNYLIKCKNGTVTNEDQRYIYIPQKQKYAELPYDDVYQYISDQWSKNEIIKKFNEKVSEEEKRALNPVMDDSIFNIKWANYGKMEDIMTTRSNAKRVKLRSELGYGVNYPYVYRKGTEWKSNHSIVLNGTKVPMIKFDVPGGIDPNKLIAMEQEMTKNKQTSLTATDIYCTTADKSDWWRIAIPPASRPRTAGYLTGLKIKAYRNYDLPPYNNPFIDAAAGAFGYALYPITEEQANSIPGIGLDMAGLQSAISETYLDTVDRAIDSTIPEN